MTEHEPQPEQIHFSEKMRKFSELPHYYQCLGMLCSSVGIIDEFYAVVDAGFDYGQALGALEHELKRCLETTNIDAWLEHYGIPSGFEEPEVEKWAEKE